MEPRTGVEEGVGLTALMVAAARAIETHRADSLARDPYAEHFVRAAAASAGWPTHPEEVPEGDDNPLWGRLGRYFGLRTRVFDDFLLSSARSGVRQVVLLGAGLDTRALRLGWPPGQTIYELDREGVMAFKHGVLERVAAAPAATRRPVPVDLCDDWSGPLLDAGFDPSLPTAWLAEGLLLYLPPEAERRMIDTIDHLSAPGSAFAYEIKRGMESPQIRAHPIYPSTRHQTGIDLLALFNTAPRPDSAATLSARGWSTTDTTPFTFTHHHGRGPTPQPHDPLSTNHWIFSSAPDPHHPNQRTAPDDQGQDTKSRADEPPSGLRGVRP
ncbi:class I SAM-dependent methyltransferase [Actinocorallia sp. A-T 12471]|uniref:class I SAM-dependent methyltransferase n=1 Tax=Actinocorallia sp. A-T 12471 TaxID=3089813 RepID=UPI0029D11857|nr:class I SAM-dependent methyltransferase [Actinocorallia sp. A-T 12471]MDX6739803.1 class I SAM-dependent methyltransferase [Actinocorallia sp. A-T 12471]